MGAVKNEIRQLSRDAGGKRRAAAAAEEWFQTSSKSVREKAVSRSARRFEPGKIYVFRYENPVSAFWWDSNPVVLALDPSDVGNDMGINLNMLPVPLKEDLLDFVYDQYEQYIAQEKAETKLDKSNKAERLDFDKEDKRNLHGPVTIINTEEDA